MQSTMNNNTNQTTCFDSILTTHKDRWAKRKQRRKSGWYQSLVEFIEPYYMEFMLITTLYVMEPWERVLVMSVLLLLLSLVSYSACIYMSYHFGNIIQWSIPKLIALFTK